MTRQVPDHVKVFGFNMEIIKHFKKNCFVFQKVCCALCVESTFEKGNTQDMEIRQEVVAEIS